MSFTFSFKFRFSDGQYLSSDEYEKTINIPGFHLSLLGSNDKSINQSEYLLLRGKGFGSEEEAFICGKRFQTLLHVCGFLLNNGIDLGKGQELVYFPTEISKIFTRAGNKLIADINGLIVSNENDRTFTIESKKTRLKVYSNTDTFIEKLSFVFHKKLELTNNELLALELFNSIFFESSIQVKFLNLVTIIEVLAGNKEKENEITLKFIDSLLDNCDLIKGKDNEQVKKFCVENSIKIDKVLALSSSFRSKIGGLKNKSIRQSTTDFISEKIGHRHSENWDNIYQERSNLVHNGKYSCSEIDFKEKYNMIYQIITLTFNKIIR